MDKKNGIDFTDDSVDIKIESDCKHFVHHFIWDIIRERMSFYKDVRFVIKEEDIDYG